MGVCRRVVRSRGGRMTALWSVKDAVLAWQIGPPMTPAELIGILSLLKVNRSEAARLLGVQYRTVLRWCQGEQEIPKAVELALRLMLKHGEKPEDWTT